MAPASHALATSARPSARQATGMQTQTSTELGARAGQPGQADGTLHLRGDGKSVRTEESTHAQDGRRIHWAEDVVDNEGLGRKSSKVCCIYHRPHAVDESSDDSSDGSDSSDSGQDDGAARPVGGKRGRRRRHGPCDHGDAGGHGNGKGRARSPNAYEKMPESTKTSSHKSSLHSL